MCPQKHRVRQNKGDTGVQITKVEEARRERQGEDVCVCSDDREKDRYGESVTVPIWARRRRQRQIMSTETGVSDEHQAWKCKTPNV